jgi:hypothetical protein
MATRVWWRMTGQEAPFPSGEWTTSGEAVLAQGRYVRSRFALETPTTS